jgi:hypothetical protein
MRKGSIPRSIALPAGLIEPNHAPDGLTEADIDALIAEVDAEVTPVRPRPGWLSADSIEHRRDRHRTRQAARSLASHWVIGGVPSQGKTAVIRAAVAGALAAGPDWDEVA